MSDRNKLLLTFQYLKDNSSIEINVDPSKLRPIVLFAQEVRFQGLVNTLLFEYMLSAATTTGTYSGITDPIMTTFIEDYMKPCLVHYCVSEYLDSNQVNLANIGPTENSSTNTSTPPLDKLKLQIAKAEKTANFYATRVKEYICDATNWPSFSSFYTSATRKNLEAAYNPRRGGIYIPAPGDTWSNFTKYRL